MPTISVVIASKVGAPFVDACLDSVRAQAEALGAEVIVVTTGADGYAARLVADFPWARIVHAPDIHPIPALRRRGVEAAQGKYIAVIEEHCWAESDWLTSALRALDNGTCVAVGGPIVDGNYDRVRDWAVYFLEYHGALPPATGGETTDLNDANIAYRKDVLDAHSDRLGDGYWLMTLHPTLLAEGMKFRSVPDMIVYKRGPFPFGNYLRQRFLFSRAYAGVRARNQGGLKRLAYVVGAPLVPFLLLSRITGTVIGKRCHVAKFVRALPLLSVALVVLVAGEWVGCVLGPGDALSKVE